MSEPLGSFYINRPLAWPSFQRLVFIAERERFKKFLVVSHTGNKFFGMFAVS